MAESKCTWSATRPQTVHLDSQEFSFEHGEYIITEYSYKYTLPGFAGLALRAGFELVKNWEDRERLFSVLFLRVRTFRRAPEAEFAEFKQEPAQLVSPVDN